MDKVIYEVECETAGREVYRVVADSVEEAIETVERGEAGRPIVSEVLSVEADSVQGALIVNYYPWGFEQEGRDAAADDEQVERDENPHYGPGNPDYDYDFEKESE